MPTGTTTHLALSLDAAPSSVREARNAAAHAVSEVGLSAQAVDDVRLCVSEAVANVVRHAYATSGVIRLVVESRDDELVISVRDSGVGLTRITLPASPSPRVVNRNQRSLVPAGSV